MNDQPDFYMASSEVYDLEKPRKCWRIKRLRGDNRDDYLLIRVDPPISGEGFGLDAQNLDKIMVATRHKGVSLFPITEWPVYVYVCRLLIDNPENREALHSGEFVLIAWAALYETLEAASRVKAI